MHQRTIQPETPKKYGDITDTWPNSELWFCLTKLLVKEALARGKRQHIVHCDWFEISAVNDKKEPERDYSMRNILAKQNAAKRELARIEKGKREGERAVNTSKMDISVLSLKLLCENLYLNSISPDLFHIYIDREFFQYQIDITRDDDEKGELGQRYTLYVSHPHEHPANNNKAYPFNNIQGLQNIALGIQRQTPSLLVRRQVHEEKRRQSAQLPPPKSLLRPMAPRNGSLRGVFPHQDGHRVAGSCAGTRNYA